MPEKIKIMSILNKGFVYLDQIVKRSNISKKVCIECLNELVSDNIVFTSPKTKHYGLIKTGIVDVKSAGYGFISVEGEEDDYYISPSELKGVYDGDTVKFYPFNEGEKHLCAIIIVLLALSTTSILIAHKCFSPSLKG